MSHVYVSVLLVFIFPHFPASIDPPHPVSPTSTPLASVRPSIAVIKLFYAFALVPEDTVVPLEILGMIYATSTSNSNSNGSNSNGSSTAVAAADVDAAPPRLLIRKWLKMLIDRSLVLGTVDRPQLHDIVGEFLIAQFTTAEMKAAQKRIVNAFRAHRPPDGWQAIGTHGNKKALYIVQGVELHIKDALNEDWKSDAEAISWLEDINAGAQDAISFGTANVLGVEKLAALVDQAEASGHWWVAALRQTHFANIVYLNLGDKSALPQFKKAVGFFEKWQKSGQVQTVDNDSIELATLLRILKCWDPASRTQCATNENLLRGHRRVASSLVE